MAAHKDCQNKNYNALIDKAIDLIAETGISTTKALKEVGVSFSKFCDMLDLDENREKRYARACDLRAEILTDEIIEISDESNLDKKTIIKNGIEVEIVDNEAINRSRLRVDSRKWLAGKLKPKKYGDKIDVTSDNEKINQIAVFELPNDNRNDVKPK